MESSESYRGGNNKHNPFRKSTKVKKTEDFFDVDFEESHANSTGSCTLSQISQLQDAGNIFKNPTNPKKLESTATNVFNVDFEDSKEVSQNLPGEVNSSLQKSNEELSQDITVNFRKPKLFRNIKHNYNNSFDFDLDESNQILSQNTQSSQKSVTSTQNSEEIFSQNERENSPLFQSKKSQMNNSVNVDFEDSKELSQALQNVSQSTQKSDQVCSKDTVNSFKQPKLFSHFKKSSNQAFNFDLKETDQVLTQNIQSSQTSTASSQKSDHILTQNTPERQSLFQNHKKFVNTAFEVDFEDSCQQEEKINSQNSQVSQSSESNKENVENISSTFVRSGLFKDTRERLNKPFDVDFEESKNITDYLSTAKATPVESNIIPFRKSNKEAKEDDFSVNFNETNVETDGDSFTEKIVTGALEKSIPRLNVTETSNFNESSFNDENMQEWMSDHSEDEIPIEQHVEKEGSRRSTLLPDRIPSPPDVPPEEDHMQQLERKLKEIVENGRRGKCYVNTPQVIRQTVKEKFKKAAINNKNVTAKSSLKKPAPFATKRLYDYLIRKIRSKYGIDAVIQAEELVVQICDVVKTVVRRKDYQKKLINDLKMEMAKMGVIETTYQFYEFVREFLPYEFRIKTVPSIQPGTNIVYPPKDGINPFEKIL